MSASHPLFPRPGSRVYLGAMLRLAVALSLGLAQALAAQTAPNPTKPPALVIRNLSETATRYRLVPDGRRVRDTTSWTVTRRVVDRSRALALQVMTSISHGDTVVDSVLFNARTLVPVWEHAGGRQSWRVAFGAARITGYVSGPDSAQRPVDVAIPGFAYSSTMDNVVVRALPLRPGYQIAVPFWDGDRLEMDTVRVRALGGRPQGAWVVDFVEPYATETLWIDRSSRRVLRHVYVYARDGSRAHVDVARSRQPLSRA